MASSTASRPVDPDRPPPADCRRSRRIRAARRLPCWVAAVGLAMHIGVVHAQDADAGQRPAPFVTEPEPDTTLPEPYAATAPAEPPADFVPAATPEGLPLRVMQPEGESRATVILAHGCGGYSIGREVPWARTFRARGFASVTFDSWALRRIQDGVCQTDTVTGDQRVEDVRLVVQYLKTQPWHHGPIYLIGWSHGGMTALKASTMADLGITKAVAVYPWCERHHAGAVIPVQLHIGGSDDWTPAHRCRALYGGLFGIGTNPLGQYFEYPGAYHDFDRWMPVDRTYDGRGERGIVQARRQKSDPAARALLESRVLAFFDGR